VVFFHESLYVFIHPSVLQYDEALQLCGVSMVNDAKVVDGDVM